MPSLTRTNCRICFIPCEDSAIEASEVAETYYEATGYEMYASDIPQKVCKECFDQLMIVKEFRGICETSEKFLEEQRQERAKETPMSDPDIQQAMVIEADPIDIREEGEIPNNLTFEEYESIQKQEKLKRKRVTNKRIVRKKRPTLSKRTKLVHWDYYQLQYYLETKKIKMTNEHLFILNYTLSPPVERAVNLDTADYREEFTSSDNIISCTYCKYSAAHQNVNSSVMQDHCDCLSTHSPLFRCWRGSCKFTSPCLDLLRRHNVVQEHNKQLVLLQPLRCNFCAFSCCFETNMTKHWHKMHPEMAIPKCLKCETSLYCDDLKLQHIVFQCRDGNDTEMAEALKLPFTPMLQGDEKSVYYDEPAEPETPGELENLSEQQDNSLESEQEIKEEIK